MDQIEFIKEMKHLHRQYSSQLHISGKLTEFDANIFSYEIIRDLIVLHFLAEDQCISILQDGNYQSLTAQELFLVIAKHDALGQVITLIHDGGSVNIELTGSDATILIFPPSFSRVSSSFSDITTELLVISNTTELLKGFLSIACKYCWHLSEYDVIEVNCLTPRLLSALFEVLYYDDRINSSSAQKESGSYYTPAILATFMSRRLLINYFEVNPSKDYPSILDPAVGTGQLLLAIAQELFTKYDKASRSPDISPFSPSTTKTKIINHLYGIDLNQDALIICYYRFWLWWLVVDDQRIDLPEWQIRYGDALAFDSEGDFLITNQFTSVFSASSGFDLIIGNPPYVDHKLLVDRRIELQKRFRVYSSTADLSQYFVELGEALLNDQGMLCYITTNQFLRTNYGRHLRGFLSRQCHIHELISFGTQEMFYGLTISTMIMLISRKNYNLVQNQIRVIDLSNLTSQDLVNSVSLFEEQTSIIDQNELTEEPWHLNSGSLTEIFEQIKTEGTKLEEIDSIQIQRGVTTGRNSVFLIDTALKDEITDAPEIIKSCIQGRDIKKNQITWNDTWLLMILQGTDLTAYPSLQIYLEQHRKILQPKPADLAKNHHWSGRKPGSYQWYELQDSTAFHHLFEKQKIVWGLTSHRWGFALDLKGHYLPSNGYILVSEHISLYYLTALLNSSVMEFYFSMIGTMTAGSAYTLKHSTIRKLPIVLPNLANIDGIKKIIEAQQEVMQIVEDQGSADLRLNNLYKEIDHLCSDLFHLDLTQRDLICNHLDNFHSWYNKLT